MIQPERRRAAFAAPLPGRVALAWLAISLLMLATNWAAIRGMVFPDPDDALRLVQVRDLIAGQGWFDLRQHRIDPANGGVPMHWSRLVDLPLAGLILLLSPLLGQPLAETVTLVAVPLLTMGCALLLAGRLAWRAFDAEVAGLACLAMALSVPVMTQIRPLRIDHHGWQIVAALAVVNGLMARSPRTGGWVAGLAMAAWLSISLEGLPLAAVLAGIAALRWLRDRREGALLVHLMLALASGSAALFLATRGLSDLGQHCDAVSPAHLAVFGWGALVLAGLGALRPKAVLPLLAGFAVAAGGGLAILLALAPQCAGGAFVELDPVVRTMWFDNIPEGLPVWRQPLADALQIVIPALVALIAALRIARSTAEPWLRRWWLDYALLLAAALGVALLVARAGAVAGALAAVPLGWQLREWLKGLRTERRPARRILAAAGIAIALLPAMPVTLYTALAPRPDLPRAIASTAPRASSCDIPAVAAALNRLPVGDFLTPLDIGPRLLLETRHTVVATSHHRAGPAMREVIDAFTGSAGVAHAAVRRRGIEYLALCPDLAEATIYREAAPAGFATALAAGHAPAWLEPVPLPGDGGLKLWRVRPARP